MLFMLSVYATFKAKNETDQMPPCSYDESPMEALSYSRIDCAKSCLQMPGCKYIKFSKSQQDGSSRLGNCVLTLTSGGDPQHHDGERPDSKHYSLQQKQCMP